ncbi:MAG: SGNH/GDSL hydrolase family protein, partial [Actinomycetota bacterium]
DSRDQQRPRGRGLFSLSRPSGRWLLVGEVVLVALAAIVLLVVTSGPATVRRGSTAEPKGPPATSSTTPAKAGAPSPVATAVLISGKEANFPTTAATPPTMVIIGDSNAWLWQMYAPGIPNLGRIGLDTAQVAATVPQALAFHPKYVVITAGTGDLLLGDSWQQTFARLKTMATAVEAGGATPVFVTVQQFGSAMKTAPWVGIGLWGPPVGTTTPIAGASQITALDTAIAGMGVPYITTPPDSLTIDGEHLGAQGYEMLNQDVGQITGTPVSPNGYFLSPGTTTLPLWPGTPAPTTVIVGDATAWLWQLYAPGDPNLALLGANTSQVAASIPAALAFHPKYVVIAAGTNDLLEGASWQQTATHLQAIAREVVAGGATPILVDVQPYGTTMVTAPWVTLGLWPATVGPTVTLEGADQVAPLNAALARMGYPDIQPAPESTTFDGLHLGSAGYATMGNELGAAVR